MFHAMQCEIYQYLIMRYAIDHKRYLVKVTRL